MGRRALDSFGPDSLQAFDATTTIGRLVRMIDAQLMLDQLDRFDDRIAGQRLCGARIDSEQVWTRANMRSLIEVGVPLGHHQRFREVLEETAVHGRFKLNEVALLAILDSDAADQISKGPESVSADCSSSGASSNASMT